MPGRDKQRSMIASAIQSVLDRQADRVAIGSLSDLRRMYETELAVNYAKHEARADRFAALKRETITRVTGQTIRCTVCEGPMPDAQRFSRRYCSDRCRQRAYRKRQ
jgi:hypothetical protein